MSTRGTLAAWMALAVCLPNPGLWAQPAPSNLSEEVKTLPDATKPHEAGPAVALPVPGFDPVTNPAPVPMNRNEAATALVATTYRANWLSEGLSLLEREELAQKGQGQTRAQGQRRGQSDPLSRLGQPMGPSDFGWQGADRSISGNRFSPREASLNFGGFGLQGPASGLAFSAGAAAASAAGRHPEDRYETPTKPMVNPYLETPASQEPAMRSPVLPTPEPAKPGAAPPSRPAPEPTPVVDAGKYFPQLKR